MMRSDEMVAITQGLLMMNTISTSNIVFFIICLI